MEEFIQFMSTEWSLPKAHLENFLLPHIAEQLLKNPNLSHVELLRAVATNLLQDRIIDQFEKKETPANL